MKHVNFQRVGILLLISLALGVLLSATDVRGFDLDFLKIFWTSSAFLYATIFAIQAGLSPGRIPNNDYYVDIVRNILCVRETSSAIFAVSVFFLLCGQFLSTSGVGLFGMTLADAAVNIGIVFCALAGTYYILNARVLHNLSIDIEKVRRSIEKDF